MVIETVSEIKTIKASKDLFVTETYVERLDKELERLISDLINKKTIEPNRIKKTAEDYIKTVGALLTILEQEKRRVEAQAELELREIWKLLDIEKNVNSQTIKEKLRQLGGRIDKFSKLYASGQRRGVRGRAPLGYILKKIGGKRRLLADSRRRLSKTLARQAGEQTSLASIKELMQRLTQHTDQNTRKLIEQEVISLIDNYKHDIDDLLTIEVDFEIEEAERLHKIDQYRKFLDKLGIKEYDEQLKNLRQRTLIWVFQDFQEAKKMKQFAKQLGQLLKTASRKKTSKDSDLAYIEAVPTNISTQIKGTLYRKDRNPKSKGIVVTPGMWTNRGMADPLCRKLADAGFLVYIFDLPGHGEATKEFLMARATEYIFYSANLLQQFGCSSIGVFGHSAGGMATVYASLGYDHILEKEIFEEEEKYVDTLAVIEKTKNPAELEKEKLLLGQHLGKIEYKIARALDRMQRRLGSAKLRSFVLSAPADSFQSFVPPMAIRLVNKLTIIFGATKVLKVMEDTKYPTRGFKESARGLKIHDHLEFVNFIKKMRGVTDYISLLEYFSKRSPRIHQYLTALGSIPKLLTFGVFDIFIRPFFGSNKKRYIELFKKLGNVQIKYEYGLGHIGLATHPRAIKHIIEFFKATL